MSNSLFAMGCQAVDRLLKILHHFGVSIHFEKVIAYHTTQLVVDFQSEIQTIRRKYSPVSHTRVKIISISCQYFVPETEKFLKYNNVLKCNDQSMRAIKPTPIRFLSMKLNIQEKISRKLQNKLWKQRWRESEYTRVAHATSSQNFILSDNSIFCWHLSATQIWVRHVTWPNVFAWQFYQRIIT